MKTSLHLKQSTNLTLTPQLQQSIKLLQLSTIELNQEIHNIIEKNPLLELEEEISSNNSERKNEIPENNDDGRHSNYEQGNQNYGKPLNEDVENDNLIRKTVTLREHVLEQMFILKIDGTQKQLILFLIDNLDDNGYLNESIDELYKFIPVDSDISIEQLQQSIETLKHLDPLGLGSKDLSECLKIQLEEMPSKTPLIKEAVLLVDHHLEKLASKDFYNLKKILDCNDDGIRQVQKIITNLNPRPSSIFSGESTNYITPDVIVRKHKNEWLVSLNQDAMPKIKVNELYAKILKQNRDKNSKNLSDQLQEARFLVKNIQQRFDTILRVSQEIVNQQKRFFEHGDIGMKPLVLKKIADVLELHESTVSRVTTQKYLDSPRGIYELKYFFSSHVTTDKGDSFSATAIRALIKQIIQEENKKSPLSDNKISKVLSEKGIMVARRTIAKYRESLQILPVSLRKKI